MPHEIEYFFFMLPPDAWRKRPSPSTWRMTREEAAKRYPGATPILESREVRSGEPLIGHSSPPMPGSEAWKALHGEE